MVLYEKIKYKTFVTTGGAGGKGVWGKLGVELDETGICKDVHDPNYDSDVQVNFLSLVFAKIC